MLEFKVIEELETNTEILESLLEYKVNEISSRNFYIKENNQKYNLKEIKQILTKFKNF